VFDIAFSELVVIGVVALIVIGPEKLPKVARTVGLLVGRLQRYVSNVKDDISREMQLEDLKKLQQQMQESGQKIQSELMLSKQAVSQHLDEVRDTLLEHKNSSTEMAEVIVPTGLNEPAKQPVSEHLPQNTQQNTPTVAPVDAPTAAPDTKDPQK